MLPGGVVMIASPRCRPAMIRAWGAGVTLAVGAGARSVGFVERGVFGSSVLTVGISAFVVSVGVAFALAAMPVLITRLAVPLDQTASANSVNSLVRAVGTSGASAVGAAVLAASAVMVGATAVPSPIGLDRLFWLGAAVSAVALIVVVCVPLRLRTGTARVDTDAPGPDPARVS